MSDKDNLPQYQHRPGSYDAQSSTTDPELRRIAFNLAQEEMRRRYSHEIPQSSAPGQTVPYRIQPSPVPINSQMALPMAPNPDINTYLGDRMKTSAFRERLISVLTPSGAQANSMTPSVFPDRNCDIPGPGQTFSREVPLILRTRASQPNLRTPTKKKPATPRKPSGRSSSCSKLPRRRSTEIKTRGVRKRPCDLADEALAAGTPLCKEARRALNNRVHARNSRLRAKAKEQHLLTENATLWNQIAALEQENIKLKAIRSSLVAQGVW